jgi:cytochrome d ubiquinol oxidase subunit II
MLPLIFAGLLAFIIIMYVILDGFDLGIGILFPFTHSEQDRDNMMNSVAPVWDGNETWLVFGGAMLYGAFPKVYGELLPIIYMPIMLMLIFRGVSFEFRFKAERSKPIWNWSFAIGSICAAFFQGVILGYYIEGFKVNDVAMTTSHPDWLTPFSLFTGIALVCGYGLLGSTWMIIKSEGRLQERMIHHAKGLLILISLFLIFVSIWTPLSNPNIFHRWYSFPNIIYLTPLPLITALMIYLAWKNLSKGPEKKPFFYSIVIFLCAYGGLGISFYPYLIPNQVTIWQAAAPDTTLRFILVGVSIMVPILFVYTLYAYHVFRGKTQDGYH